MEPLDEAKLVEEITIYENKIKAIKDKIGDELRKRRDYKEKLREAKRREATQILILERLDEYQKIVNQQIEATAKMEDTESVKQMAMIEKYESMLREQREIWAKYEAEYESLPLAKERRASELQLLKLTIQNKLICHKIEETKRMLKMKAQINRRIAQLKIIEFAKLYVEHKKKEICCSKLANKVKSLKFQEKELRSEVERMEKQAVESKRRDSVITKSAMLSQQLPKVDLSAYIISRDKRDDAFDNQSINSYKLEQEYVNSDIYMNQDSSQSNDATMIENNSDKEKNSQGLLNDSMDIDDDEYQQQAQQKQHAPTKTQKFQRTADRKMNFNNHESARNNAEKQAAESNQQKINRENAMSSEGKQDQSRKSERATEHDRRANFKNMFNNDDKQVHSNNVLNGHQQRTRNFEQVNENERRANFQNASKSQEKEAQRVHEHERRTNVNAAKNSHGNQPDTSQVNDGNNIKRRANQSKQQIKDDEQQFMNRGNPSERPIPTPAKMAKHIPEQYQQQTHSNSPKGHRNPEQSNFRRDLSKLPQGNKPCIKSCERVNYQVFQPQREATKPLVQAMPMPPMESFSNAASMIAHGPMDQQDQHQHQQQQDQPQMFRSVSMEMMHETVVSGSPITSMNNMLNMETPSMISGLMDMHADANSDISMILGSEITEPGGSMELAKRFYDDSDMNSEDGFSYDKMLQKLYSPIVGNPRQEQPQPQQQPVDNAQSKSQEQRDLNFTISNHTAKKQTNQSQRFF